MVKSVWQQKEVQREWVDAIIVPIPNLRSCDNWRGIALPEVVGKVAARVIQGKLQRLAQRELLDSQCGFRNDSVPRDALWKAMRKLGVPEVLVEIVKSFHEGMEARVRVGDKLLDEIEVRIGLRQGCTMASTLFNLYACVVAERWFERVKDVKGVGTCIFYKIDQQLFRRKECQFVDDIALLATTHKAAEEATRAYQDVALAFGLTVNISKTKFMVVGYNVSESECQPIGIEGAEIEHVSEFEYWVPSLLKMVR